MIPTKRMCSLNATAVFPVSTLTHMFGQGSILKNFNVHITVGSAVYKQKSPETPPRISAIYKRVLSIQVMSQAVTFRSRLSSERLVCQKFDS